MFLSSSLPPTVYFGKKPNNRNLFLEKQQKEAKAKEEDDRRLIEKNQDILAELSNQSIKETGTAEPSKKWDGKEALRKQRQREEKHREILSGVEEKLVSLYNKALPIFRARNNQVGWIGPEKMNFLQWAKKQRQDRQLPREQMEQKFSSTPGFQNLVVPEEMRQIRTQAQALEKQLKSLSDSDKKDALIRKSLTTQGMMSKRLGENSSKGPVEVFEGIDSVIRRAKKRGVRG